MGNNIEITYANTIADFTSNHTHVNIYCSDIEFDYDLEDYISDKDIAGNLILIQSLRKLVKLTIPISVNQELLNWGTSGATYTSIMQAINARYKKITITDTAHVLYSTSYSLYNTDTPVLINKNYTSSRWGSNRTKKIELELVEYAIRFGDDVI